jgi:hypothetical protein
MNKKMIKAEKSYSSLSVPTIHRLSLQKAICIQAVLRRHGYVQIYFIG